MAGDFGPGSAAIYLPEMPGGAYVLECKGSNNAIVKQLVIKR